jgi:hypothetical protein
MDRDSGRPAKVFGIGLNKTGTTSLDHALTALGYSVHGPQKDLLKRCSPGNIAALDPVVEAHDGFQDWPWPLYYRELFERYGDDTLFVLTMRSSPERWFESQVNHAMTRALRKGEWDTFGYYRPFGRQKQYCDFYIRHNQAVRDFFRENNAEHRLLEICFETDDGWSLLCEFVGKPVPAGGFPHSNRNTGKRHRGRQLMNALVRRIYEPLVRSG